MPECVSSPYHKTKLKGLTKHSTGKNVQKRIEGIRGSKKYTERLTSSKKNF